MDHDGAVRAPAKDRVPRLHEGGCALKIHIVYDLASESTRDVADGIRAGLVQLGHEVCGSHVYAYTQAFLRRYESIDEIPPEERAAIMGAVNKLVIADVALRKPDALLVISGWCMSPYTLRAIEDIARGCATALWLTESPYQDEEQAQLLEACYDVVFCNELSSLDVMRRYSHNVHYLPHSYNPEVHYPRTPNGCGHEVYMCATGFRERLEAVSALDYMRYDVQLDGFWPKHEEYGIPRGIIGGTVHNARLPEHYSASKVNLNVHRTTKVWRQNAGDEERILHAESVGPRVLEVMACGGFLLTDPRRELDLNGWWDGEHLACFSSSEELPDKVRYYLQHDAERDRIAAAGKEAVKDCTFARRAEEIIIPAIEEVR